MTTNNHIYSKIANAQYNARRARAQRTIAVQRRLMLRFGKREFKLVDVLDAIRAEHLPPFKTRDRMLRTGLLTFVGKHVKDQRYLIP